MNAWANHVHRACTLGKASGGRLTYNDFVVVRWFSLLYVQYCLSGTQPNLCCRDALHIVSHTGQVTGSLYATCRPVIAEGARRQCSSRHISSSICNLHKMSCLVQVAPRGVAGSAQVNVDARPM